jgi:hypothetical protein
MHHEDAVQAAGWIAALEHSALGDLARHSFWLYPLCGVLHLVGLGLLVGSILAFDLRLIGITKRLALDAAARQLLPTALLGFGLSLSTGFVMFSADATHLVRNPIFLTKLGVIVLAGLNAALFHARASRAVISGRADAPALRHAKLAGMLSIAFWLGTVSLGRLIAYF